MKVVSMLIASGIAISNGQKQEHHSIRRRNMKSMFQDEPASSALRQLKGKGKATTPDSYEWVVGNYTVSKTNQILLIDGDFPQGNMPPTGDQSLSITRRGDAYEATYAQNISAITSGFGCDASLTFTRLIYEAVPSYNPKYQDEITFYSDHTEYFNGTDWIRFLSDEVSGTASIHCSLLKKDGSSITCDVYEHEVWTSLSTICGDSPLPDGLTLEIISSTIWTETSE